MTAVAQPEATEATSSAQPEQQAESSKPQSKRVMYMTGLQKVALVLMQLEQEQAAAVLSLFPEDEAQEIAAEIMRTGVADEELAVAALDEFYEMALAGRPRPIGGKDYAVSLLEASYGPERAGAVVDRLMSAMQGRPFEYLEGVDYGQILSLLDGEHPQTIALVLSHLAAPVASGVLGSLDDEVRTDVAQAIATMGTASPDAVHIVSEQFRTRIGASLTDNQPVEVVGGVQPLVDIINRADVATEKAVLEGLEARDPILAEEVRSRMLTFEDITSFTARDVQTILRGIQIQTLALAIKGSSAEVQETIKRNISERNRELLEDEVAALGGVRLNQVEEARAEIVRIIRELEAQEKITITRGEAAELVY